MYGGLSVEVDILYGLLAASPCSCRSHFWEIMIMKNQTAYLHDAMLLRYWLPLPQCCLCLSLFPPHASFFLLERLNSSSWFLTQGNPSTYSTLRCKEIRVPLTRSVLLFGTLCQTLPPDVAWQRWALTVTNWQTSWSNQVSITWPVYHSKRPTLFTALWAWWGSMSCGFICDWDDICFSSFSVFV